MKADFNEHRDVWGPLFSLQLNAWSQTVLAPSCKLRAAGLYKPSEWGVFPSPLVIDTVDESFSREGIIYEPLNKLPTDYNKVQHFDIIAAEYESSVAAFKKPVRESAYQIIKQLVPSQARIADIACGPGYETISLSRLVPDKEVCAIDLSTEMTRLAFRNATEQVIPNACFYQADIEKELPAKLYGKFDAIFCQFSFSYFSQHSAVANNFHRLLKAKGLAFLIEPDDTVMNRMSFLTAKAAVPHLNDYYSRDTLSGLFLSAGFSAFYWQELLPGIGLSIISK